MTSTDEFILRTINARDGEWNGNKLGRYCLSHLENPGELTLEPLFRAGFIEERSVRGEPLRRLYITEAGKSALGMAASQ